VARRARKASLGLGTGPPVRNIPATKSSLPGPSATPTIVSGTPEKPSRVPTLLRAVAALGASTLLVGGTAFAGVQVIRTIWGVNTIPEFSRRMRNELSTRFPGFSKVMESSLATDLNDDELDDPALEEWDYDASKDRLMKAFDEGGFSRLSEVAWEEMKLESRVFTPKTSTRAVHK